MRVGESATCDAWMGLANSLGHRSIEAAPDSAAWYHTGLTPVPLRRVPIPDLAWQCATRILLRTDQAAMPEQRLGWFVRWRQSAVTREEIGRHRGAAARWFERAIRHTTSALLGRARAAGSPRTSARQAAWHRKADRLSPPHRRSSVAKCGGTRRFTRPSVPTGCYSLAREDGAPHRDPLLRRVNR